MTTESNPAFRIAIRTDGGVTRAWLSPSLTEIAPDARLLMSVASCLVDETETRAAFIAFVQMTVQRLCEMEGITVSKFVEARVPEHERVGHA
jgi:hypothetical protein